MGYSIQGHLSSAYMNWGGQTSANIPWLTGEENKDRRLHLSSQFCETSCSFFLSRVQLSPWENSEMGLKCYSAALCPIQGKRLHARVNLHGFFLHQATHSWWEDRTPTLGRPGRLNLKGTILDQRKGSERNVKGHKTLPTYPKLLTVDVMAISVQASKHVCHSKVMFFTCVTPHSSWEQSGRNSWCLLAPAHIFHAQGST